MTDQPPLDEGRTPEERERLERLRRQATAIPGLDVKFGFLDNAAVVEAIADNEAAVFVSPVAYTFRRHGGGKAPLLPTIELDGLEWMQEAIRRNTLRCGAYGIGREIEGQDVGWFAHLQLRVGIVNAKETPLYVWLIDAPEEWLRWALRRFAISFPDAPGIDYPWLATGQMSTFPEGFVLPPKLGRNDACPCGSGKKAKRCCLR